MTIPSSNDNTVQCMIIQYNVWPLQVRKNWLDTRTLCCVHWHWDNFLTNIKCLLGKVQCLRFWDCLECWCGPPDVFTLVLINMLKVLQISGRVSNSVTSLGSHSPRHKTTGSLITILTILTISGRAIPNVHAHKDARCPDYPKLRLLPKPGHCTFVGHSGCMLEIGARRHN